MGMATGREPRRDWHRTVPAVQLPLSLGLQVLMNKHCLTVCVVAVPDFHYIHSEIWIFD